MQVTGRAARIVHAIPGRLRIRFADAPSDGLARSDGLDSVRVAPGVLGVDVKPAARSAVIRYDPAEIGEATVLTALERAGISLLPDAGAERSPAGPAERPATTRQPAGEREAGTTPRAAAPPDSQDETLSTLRDVLIGPPPKLDRRFAESVALSIVSLLAARRVGVALGGGTTLPAYFAIWFALRRITGARRRR